MYIACTLLLILVTMHTDPKTQAYLRAAFDPIFGYPSIVRFSWGTVKIAMDKNGVPCTWSVVEVSFTPNVLLLRDSLIQD